MSEPLRDPGRESHAAPLAPRRSGVLPPLDGYLRAVVALGRRAVRPALPAIVFFYFYLLGTKLYLEYSSVAMDRGAGQAAAVVSFVMILAVALPIQVLAWAPLVPLLDAIHGGGSLTFGAATRRVLEVAFRYIVSLITQLIIVCGPLLILAVIGAALTATVSGGWLERIRPGGGIPHTLRATIFLGVLVPAMLWLAFSLFHLIFASPGVLIGGRGAFGSIGESWRLVQTHFGGLAGRLMVFFLLYMLVMVVAKFPSAILDAALEASESLNPMIKIPSIIWSSAVEALISVFWIAAILVLYRAVVPAAATAGGVAEGEPPGAESRPTSPFVFE